MIRLPRIFCMIGVFIAVFVYWKNANPIVINYALASIGTLIYGSVMLIVVSALNLFPKKAAKTVASFTGILRYTGGEVFAEIPLGTVVYKFSWNGRFIMLMSFCILSIVPFYLPGICILY